MSVAEDGAGAGLVVVVGRGDVVGAGAGVVAGFFAAAGAFALGGACFAAGGGAGGCAPGGAGEVCAAAPAVVLTRHPSSDTGRSMFMVRDYPCPALSEPVLPLPNAVSCACTIA